MEKVYSLRQAVKVFFPDGPLTVSSLRNEIRKGRLIATKPAGKLLVTESAIVEMLELCRVNACLPTCSSSAESRLSEVSGASETERTAQAQAAANAILKAQKRN